MYTCLAKKMVVDILSSYSSLLKFTKCWIDSGKTEGQVKMKKFYQAGY